MSILSANHFEQGSLMVKNLDRVEVVIIGAGAVVLKDVDSNTILVGNPAKKI